MAKIIIERTGGPYPANRYGIILRNLKRRDRQFLVEHRHMRKWAGSDQFVGCVLRMKENGRQIAARKLYWDFESSSVVNGEELVKRYNTIDWVCAISLKPIKAKFMNFDLDNFVHPEYRDVLDAPMVDSRILKSSIEFRKACEKLLIKQRDKFLKLAKKGSRNTDNLDKLKED